MKHGSPDIVDFSDHVDGVTRLQLFIKGLVQGVGFRPFVYRLATDLGLAGWVRNTAQGVQIELEGKTGSLNEFVDRLASAKPLHARIDDVRIAELPPIDHAGFTVKQSDDGGLKGALILPDIAVCKECVREVFDPDDRRFRYPFTNCTNCGPRFSIIESLPYDRANTTMRVFPMCRECRQEYEDPLNRRFHAQPNACPSCGPHLELWNGEGKILATHNQALLDACNCISRGEVLALKGLGGFQLITDARNDEVVNRLRRLKARKDKPFALMYPDLCTIESHCEVSDLEAKLLTSPESPIVLLKHRTEICDTSLYPSPSVAPDNPYFGVMLPYSPLHYLLMSELEFPVVATSGNLRDEPICIDEHDAVNRLGGIADLFLVHNRPIGRQMDDSIVQLAAGRAMVLRNARGYAPTVVPLRNSATSRLAVGAHLKNSVAVSSGDRAFMSQYIGDLTTLQAYDAFSRAARSMSNLFALYPREVSCDNHPDYWSSRYAADSALPVGQVQHHFAHVLSCMAEHELNPPVLGVAWDGTGLGLDGTVWGGEFLKVADGSFTRQAHLRTFLLPGNEKAIEEPRRAALGLLYDIFGESIFCREGVSSLQAFDDTEKSILTKMLKRRINTPQTSSAGRLFDAVASIVGLCQTASFEGQAAMRLQFAACDVITEDSYSYGVDYTAPSYIIDWEPMIRNILDDWQGSVPQSLIAARFHNTLADMIVSIAERAGEQKVVLTGGCFQNKYLLEKTVAALEKTGFEPYWHGQIPPNDGGIALGQVVAPSCQRLRGA